jgi:hypothetical protein
MKKIILFLAALCLLSCSDDDGGSKKLYLESVVGTNADGSTSGSINFGYDEKGQLTSLTQGTNGYTIGYKDGLIVSVNTIGGGASFDLNYEDGKLVSLKQDDASYDVEISSDNRTYTIAGLEESFTINDKGDVTSITQAGTEYLFTYESGKKGPMYSVKTKNLFMLQFLLNGSYVMSRQPISEFLGYTSQRSYNTDGYLQSLDLIGAGQTEPTSTLHYSYTTL